MEAARGADLLVHEASFTAEDAARAAETGHSTAHDAALLALQAEVRLLALTHLGGRALPRAVEEEARAVFEATVVPRDFDMIDVPFPERGEPVHRREAARPARPGGGATAAAAATSDCTEEDET